MFSFNVERLNSGTNPPLYDSFIKFGVAITTIENLLKMTVLNNRLNKTDTDNLG